MTAFATKGRRVGFAVQSNPYTINASGVKQFRLEGAPEIATPAQSSVTPDGVFGDANDTEKPIPFWEAVSDCVKVSTLLRNAASAGGTPSIIHALRSGQYTVASPSNDTTIAAYTNTTSYTLTDAAATDAGEFRAVTLNDGRIIPVLMTADASGAAITPHYALPAAAQAGNVVRKCWTVTPGQPGPVETDKFLSLFHSDREATGTGSDSNDAATMAFLSSVGDIVLEPGKPIKIDLSFSAGKWAYDDTNTPFDATTADVFADGTGTRVVDALIVYRTAASAAGQIAAAYQKIQKATIKLGKTCTGTPGMGDAECVGNIQGAVAVNAMAELTLEMLINRLDYATFESGTSEMIAVVLPTATASDPAFAFVMPNCHLKESPKVDYAGDYIKLTATWVPRPATLGSVTTIGAQANEPWFLGISDRSA